jgi:hypothetical protein
MPELTFSEELSYNLDGDGELHRLIIGDNYRALAGMQASLATNPEGVYDLIYIDPPYNTENKEFVYNDKCVAEDDTWRSTKWLSEIEPRLILAKNLLKRTGVIFIAIDDNEHHKLRNLCDAVYGRTNFIANLVWNSPGTNTSKFAKGGADYMLVYARSKDTHSAVQGKWSRQRPGQQEMLDLVTSVRDSGGTPRDAETQLRKWSKDALRDERISKSEAAYSKVDDNWRVYMLSPITGPGYRANLMYTITDPATGKVYTPPTTGRHIRWAWSEDKMATEILNGKVVFTDKSPMQKTYLDEQGETLLDSVFYCPRNGASTHLAKVVGSGVFDHPKDHAELAKWFDVAAGKDAKVLDFYGGSGTTAEAVLMLNKQDGGTREVTIVTNDESNIGTEVTRERIVRVMSGEGWADGKSHDGYGGRLVVHRVDVARTVDFGGKRDEGEHHSWNEQAGMWGAWQNTPIPLVVNDKFSVYTDGGSQQSIVFHNIDVLTCELADAVICKYPGAKVFLPHQHECTSNSFYVPGVDGAVSLPMGVVSRIALGVESSVLDPYTTRGGGYMDTVRGIATRAVKAANEENN